MNTGRSIALAGIYFLFGAVITLGFIASKAWLFDSVSLMILSASIAASKWLVHLIAVFLLPRDNRWTFIKNMGVACLSGSAALLIYYLLPISWGFYTLAVSVGFSVLLMIFMYYRAVRLSQVSIYWLWSWIVCLTIAIFLQLTVVFDVI
jgi:hypothetical protein